MMGLIELSMNETPTPRENNSAISCVELPIKKIVLVLARMMMFPARRIVVLLNLSDNLPERKVNSSPRLEAPATMPRELSVKMSSFPMKGRTTPIETIGMDEKKALTRTMAVTAVFSPFSKLTHPADYVFDNNMSSCPWDASV
jgi:hypothetical protein